MIDNHIARPIKTVKKQCAYCGGTGIVMGLDEIKGDIEQVCFVCGGSGEIEVLE